MKTRTITLLLAIYACTSTIFAQPTGVTGYEAIELQNSAYRLDEYARVIGDVFGSGRRQSVWVNGISTVLDTPDEFTSATWGGISPTTGVIAGGFRRQFGDGPVYIWTKDGYTTLDMPLGSGSGTSCTGTSINDDGWLTARCSVPTMSALWIRNNDPTNPFGTGVTVRGINKHNEMLGYENWFCGYFLKPLSKDPPTWEWIDISPAHDDVRGNDLNNNAEVVGEYIDRDAFYWHDGVLTVLPEPNPCGGLYAYSAYAINDLGLITGGGVDSDCDGGSGYIWERTSPLGQTPHQLNSYTINDYLPRQPDISIGRPYDINTAGQMATSGINVNEEDTYYLVTPYLFNMSDPTPGIAGQVNTITVTNLVPGQLARLTWGTRKGAQPINKNCLGGLILIRDAHTHASFRATADATGTATFSIFVAESASGKNIRYQAIAPNECQISHTVEYTFE